MEVYCKYDKDLEIFLQSVVNYTLNLYEKTLDLSNLYEIELVPKETFSFDTDGRIAESGEKIILTSRLYEKLECFDIDKIKDSEDFSLIVRTIYHEMGHINDRKKYPVLYSAALDLKNMKGIFPSMFWLEYLAEKRSCSIKLSCDKEFCDNFVKRDWNVTKVNFEHALENNFYYLNKMLAYFLARVLSSNEYTLYIDAIKNKILREYIIELKKEIVNLENTPQFDSIEQLEDMYQIMNLYFKKLKSIKM